MTARMKDFSTIQELLLAQFSHPCCARLGQVEPNKDFLYEYLASFCDRIPTDIETEDLF